MRAQPLAARPGHARRREGSAGLLPNRGSTLSPHGRSPPLPPPAPGASDTGVCIGFQPNPGMCLLAAQQLAETMVSEAEQKKTSLVHDAEAAASVRIEELRAEIAAEEYRLKAAQEATAASVKKLQEMHEGELALLEGLKQLIPPAVEVEDSPADEIVANIVKIYDDAPVQAEPEVKEEEEKAAEEDASNTPVYEELDPSVTRRFENLQFSKDYHIE